MRDFDRQSGRALPALPPVAERRADDDDVATALGDLARLVTDGTDVEGLLGQIAGLALLAVPGAGGAGVTIVRLEGNKPEALTWAVTAAFVREIDRLQYDVCEEGPCLTAMTTRRALVSGSLGSDTRWTRFGGRVARLDVHSAMALPLVVRDAVVGAINVYARERDVFNEHAVRLGEQFSAPAAVSVYNTLLLRSARDRAANLQVALSSRATIDQAIGIVRSRTGGTEEEAFARLCEISQSEQLKLAVVAERIVDEAVRRARARNVGADGNPADG